MLKAFAKKSSSKSGSSLNKDTEKINSTSSGAIEGNKSSSPAHFRVQKDVSELSLPSNISVEFPNPNDLFNFTIEITPDEGFYKNATFKFSVKIKPEYPFEAPKVLCTQKIYHPNIDLEGNVCLNILREEWKPVLNLNSVVYGLQYLFLEPNATDPLNKDAASVLMNNKDKFVRNVLDSLAGGYVGSEKFERIPLKKSRK